ncbi:MAG: 5-formyltetrahydrofolate cyclo-ligase [Eubacterium sp.]|nr:5-formyltetrahydrofolate cyclo-ligase [Eubacterium sp.]
MDKKNQRKELLNKREALSKDYVSAASLKISESLFLLEEYRQSRDIFIYYAMRNEVITLSVIEKAWKDGKRVYLPITEKDDMDFFEYLPGDELTEGDFGVMIPKVKRKLVPCEGLVVIPGVGFDKRGYRIGYGKGFYDRYLRKYPALKRVGIAFDCQLTDEIVNDDFDEKLEAVITESKIYRF